jgi:hypothetical protein
MMDIEDGNVRALATPCNALNIMSSIPDLATPLRSVKRATKKQPVKLMDRGPITSANDPARRSNEPLVKANAAEGQMRRFDFRSRAVPIVGNPTVIKPVPAMSIS